MVNASQNPHIFHYYSIIVINYLLRRPLYGSPFEADLSKEAGAHRERKNERHRRNYLRIEDAKRRGRAVDTVDYLDDSR